MCVYRKEFPEYTADWAPYSLLHPGDDRFADPDELRQRFGLVRKREDLHAGGMPILAGPEGAVFQNDDSMSIVFGQSGSKKTRLLVAPTLVSLATPTATSARPSAVHWPKTGTRSCGSTSAPSTRAA